MGMSPLVTVQRLPHPPSTLVKGGATSDPNVPPCTPFRAATTRKVGGTPRPLAPGPSNGSPPLKEAGLESDDVSSPEAARARCQAVRQDYGGVRNPATLGLREKVLGVPFQRSVLFSKS